MEKRKPSTRNKGEPPAKREKRSSLSGKRGEEVVSITPKPQKLDFRPADFEQTAAGLPNKIKENKPLPTVEEPQPLNLPAEEYQSVYKSGVLAASLQRSRQKWLSEGIFEKYWTKPGKKKNQVDVANNPPTNSMVKAGQCRLMVEPHSFEITLYHIKGTAPVPLREQPRPHLQYGPPNGQFTPQSQPYPPRQPPPPIAQTTNPSSPSPYQPYQAHARTPTHTASSPATAQNGTAPGTPSSQSSVQPPQDPVIQMLASRASSDPTLKGLMRTVAQGNASPEDLHLFQSHINELNAIIEKRKQAEKAALGDPVASIHSLPSPSSMPRSTPHLQPRTHASTNHSYILPTVAAKAPAPPKPAITNICLEFNSAGSTGDRYLFPRHSILEFLPGNRQCIASFLIIRRGSAAESGTYDKSLDYYQPATVRFISDSPKVLEGLSKVVARPDEVRAYMEDVMARCTRAEYVHLAMRLPIQGTAEEDDDGEERGGKGSRSQSVSTNMTPVEGLERRKGAKVAKIVA